MSKGPAAKELPTAFVAIEKSGAETKQKTLVDARMTESCPWLLRRQKKYQ
jgi:hypothetical protein